MSESRAQMTASDWTISEVKAELARSGAQLEPDAVMQTYTRPANGASVALCVVDAVEAIDGTPDYCVHGFASCLTCDRLCYLGSETCNAISDLSLGVYPMCIQCAAVHIPQQEPVGRFKDHPRVDGPHEKQEAGGDG